MLSFIVYQAGTLITQGSLGNGFLGGLIVVIVIISIIFYMMKKGTNSIKDNDLKKFA